MGYGTIGLYYGAVTGNGTAGPSNVALYMDTAGKIGIANSSPSYALDVTGSINSTGSIYVRGTNYLITYGGTSGYTYMNTDSNGYGFMKAAGTYLYMGGGGANTLIVTNNGMSINTGAAPNYTLDVGGSANVSGKYFVGGAVQPVTYSLPNTEGTAQYIFLGTWYPSGQTGKRLTITMGCGSGYNSANSQLSKVELIVTTANGVDPQTGTGGGSFYGAAVAINSTGLGSAYSPSTFRIVQGTTTQFLIYANCPLFTGGSFYTVSLASGDSWTNSSTLYGATGPTSSTYLDVTPSVSILSTAGNVGIGTTSPGYTLDVNGNTKTSNMYVYGNPANAGVARIILGPNPSAGNLDYCSMIESSNSNAGNYQSWMKFYTHDGATSGGDPTLRMSIDNIGRVGIGQANPGYTLDVAGNINSTGNFFTRGGYLTAYGTGSAFDSNTYIVTDCNGYGFLKTSGTYLTLGAQQANTLSIASNAMSINTGAAPSYTLDVGGSCRVWNGTNGVLATSGATSWATTSDSNLKNVIAPITNATSSFEAVTPVYYSWKSDDSNIQQVGVIAQEIQQVVPEAIGSFSIGSNDYLSVRYTELIPHLIAAVKELSARLSNVEAKLAATTGS